MTTKNSFYAFAALAALTLASCNNDEEFSPQNNLKDTPITVTAAVAELSSRAGYATDNLPSTFYLTIDQTGDKYDYTNVLMKQDENGKWKAYESDETTEKTLLWAGDADKNTVTVTAATFSLDGAQTLTVEAGQSNADNVKASDHLYMTATSVTPSTNGISVKFSHIMSKVKLTITLGDEFNERETPITGVTFMGTVASNTYTAGTGWGTIATDVTTTDITAWAGKYTPIGGEVTNATAEYEVILVPQTVEANKFVVKFNVSDREFVWTSTEAVTLASGTQYTLKLTAGKDKVSKATFAATAWTGNSNSSVETE